MHHPVPPCLIPVFAGLLAHSPAFLQVRVDLVPDGQLLFQFIGFRDCFLPFPGFLQLFVFFVMGAGIQTGGHAQAAKDHEAGPEGVTGCGSYHKIGVYKIAFTGPPSMGDRP